MLQNYKISFVQNPMSHMLQTIALDNTLKNNTLVYMR